MTSSFCAKFNSMVSQDYDTFHLRPSSRMGAQGSVAFYFMDPLFRELLVPRGQTYKLR